MTTEKIWWDTDGTDRDWYEAKRQHNREVELRAKGKRKLAELSLSEVSELETNTEWLLRAVAESLLALEARLEQVVGAVDDLRP